MPYVSWLNSLTLSSNYVIFVYSRLLISTNLVFQLCNLVNPRQASICTLYPIHFVAVSSVAKIDSASSRSLPWTRIIFPFCFPLLYKHDLYRYNKFLNFPTSCWSFFIFPVRTWAPFQAIISTNVSVWIDMNFRCLLTLILLSMFIMI